MSSVETQGNKLVIVNASGRRIGARLRICEYCGDEKIIAAQSKSNTCRPCVLKNINKDKMLKPHEVYTNSKGNRCRGVLRKCEQCGTEKMVQASTARKLCVKCAANQRPNCIPENDPIIIQRGRKRRTKEIKCKTCKQEFLTRIDAMNKSGECRKCSPMTVMLKKIKGVFGKDLPAYGTGLGIYQRICKEKHGDKCLSCEKTQNIHIHHIDCDRTNNDISNLIPLCPSCHKRIHFKLNDGMSHEEASEYVKTNKVSPRYDKKSSYVSKLSSETRNTCKICSESQKRIEVHHIDQNRQNNEISNLLPLCVSCHRLIHYRLKDGLSHDKAFRVVQEMHRSGKHQILPPLIVESNEISKGDH